MSTDDWSALFSAPGPNAALWKVVPKHGQPLLLLPPDPRLAARGLDLYPAQTAKARVARAALRGALRIGLPMPWPRRPLGPLAAPLAGWLAEVSGQAEPRFVVLLGNPAALGRRSVLLVFDTGGAPRWVVKVGSTTGARALIAAEAAALASLPPGVPGVPAILGSFAAAELAALAGDFIPGTSPRPLDDASVFRLLRAWLREGASARIADLPGWQRLATAASSHPRWTALAKILGPLAVPACIYHGDFAPWNLRGAGGHWTAIDWERGEPRGMPGWDALHYVIQRAVLVERWSTRDLLDLIERTTHAPDFAAYLDAAGLAGQGDGIVLAYLLHACEVLRPTEGLPALRTLLDAWAARPAQAGAS